MEGKDKYSWQQNIVAYYSDFVGQHFSVLTYQTDGITPQTRSASSQGSLSLNESFYNFQEVNKPITVQFTKPLNPLQTKCKRITVNNITSAIASTPGYLVELACHELWRNPIHFVDGGASYVKYVEYQDSPLKSLNPIFTVRLLGGPQATSQVLTNPNADNTDPNGINADPNYSFFVKGFKQDEMLSNPTVSFSITFEYF